MECQHHLKENKEKLNEEISCISFQNQRLLRHNAMLNNQITNHDNEVAQLRNKLVKIEGENEKLQTNVIVSGNFFLIKILIFINVRKYCFNLS